jgi:hypothetical protein
MKILDRYKKDYGLFYSEVPELHNFQQEVKWFEWRNFYWSSEGSCYIIPARRLPALILWFSNILDEQLQISDNVLEDLKKQKEIETETKFIRGASFDLKVLKPDITPFPFQIEGMRKGISTNRLYYADDYGLGKSLQIVGVVSYLLHRGKIEQVVLLVRNSLVYHWVHEILEFSNIISKDDIGIVTNKNKLEKVFNIFSDKKVIVIPHHLVPDVILSYNRKGFIKKKSGLYWNKIKVDLKRETGKKSLCLVSDEHHDYKNNNSLKTRALFSVISSFNYRYFASATPSINDFSKYYSQLKMLDPNLVPITEEEFLLNLADKIGDHFSPFNVKEYNASYVKEINEKMRPVFLKRIKRNLPEMKTKKISRPIYFQLNSLHKKIYDEICFQVMEKIKDEKITEGSLFNKFTYVLSALDNPFLLEKIENEKIQKLLKRWSLDKDVRIEYLDEYVKDIVEDNGEKLIIFDSHPLTLDMLAERFKKYNPLVIHGQVKTKDTEQYRFEVQELFNDRGNDRRIALLSSITSSQGLNLQKGGNKTILYTSGNDATNFAQAQDRTHRIISFLNSYVSIFVLDNTFDRIRYLKNSNRTAFNDAYGTQSFNLNTLKRMLEGI